MVAKVFLAAAAILVCCGTTLQGECPDGKCDKSGEAATQCSTEKCSGGECSTCTKGDCKKSSANDDLKVAVVKDEECCEKKKCSAEKCSGSTCSKTACSKTACSTGACNLGQCTAGKCGDGACSLTAGVSTMCETLKCAIVDAANKEFTAECSGGTCSKSKSECSAKSCSTTACSGKSCGSECSTVTAAAEPCDTWFCFEGNCSVGECSATCSTEVCDGLKCAVEACLTLNGGQLTITTGRTFPGTVEVAVAAEECTKVSACSKSCGNECTAKCGSKCDQEVAAKCEKSACGTLACSPEKCTADESVAACSKLACAEQTCSTKTCPTAACSTEVCKSEKCGTKQWGTKQCVAEQSELDAKLAALSQLQREVDQLRQSAGTPEQLTVNVKLVEVNMSKCRQLGFSFDVTSPHMVTDLNETIEKSPDFLTALQKNGLAKVIGNPTIVALSGRPAFFHSGGEFPVSDAAGCTQFKQFGTKIDVTATTLGNNQVCVEICPEFSQVTGNCGPAPCPALSTHRWDSTLVAELGTPFVLSSACEQRVKAVRSAKPSVNAGEKDEVTEVVEDIQCFAVVTVTSVASPNVEPAEVHRAAFESEQQRDYEEELLSDIVDQELIVRVYPVADLQVWKVRPNGVEFDADLLVDYLKSSVDCDSWRSNSHGEESCGQIQPFERNGSLVISQTKKNHDKITTLIQEMRIAGLKKTEARETSEAGVVPASAVEPVSTETNAEGKCSQGGCKESACKASKCQSGHCSKSDTCSKSPVSAEIDVAAASDECTGKCPDSGDCPCIGGTCTK